MKNFVSKSKMSKKARKELDNKMRVTWGEVNPVTRKTENKKAYNRKKTQKGIYDYSDLGLFCV